MMQHTDGPWEVGGSGVLIFAGPVIIADCAPDLPEAVEDPKEIRCNVTIMAASLVMKEALAEAAEFLRNGTPIHPGSDVANSIISAVIMVEES